MRFSTIITGFLSVSGLAAAAPTVEKRALTAQQMVDNINAITKHSQNLQPVVSKLTTGRSVIAKRQIAPPQQYQDALDGLNKLTNFMTEIVKKQDGSQPYNAANAQKVCNAYSTMATTQTNLMKTFIGKSALVEGFFLGPVAASLRSYENVVDTLSFEVLDVVPSCLDKANEKKKTLDDATAKAICAYTPAGTLGLNLFC